MGDYGLALEASDLEESGGAGGWVRYFKHELGMTLRTSG